MQRKDLVKKIAEKANVKQSEAERMFNSFVDVVTEAFNDDEKIEIRGFGNFIKKTRKPVSHAT